MFHHSDHHNSQPSDRDQVAGKPEYLLELYSYLPPNSTQWGLQTEYTKFWIFEGVYHALNFFPLHELGLLTPFLPLTRAPTLGEPKRKALNKNLFYENCGNF